MNTIKRYFGIVVALILLGGLSVGNNASAETPPIVPDPVQTKLCNAQLIDCADTEPIATAPTGTQPVVTASISASADATCGTPARLSVDANAAAIVYLIEPYQFEADTYRLGAGNGFVKKFYPPHDNEPVVVAVADVNKPQQLLYAFTLTSEPCTYPPYEPEPRPYATPVVTAKVSSCGVRPTVTIRMNTSLPEGTVNVSVFQTRLKGGPGMPMEPYNTLSLGNGLRKQTVSLPWSIKSAPIIISAYDQYGEVLAPIVLTRRGCTLTYNPADVLESYFGGYPGGK